MNDVNDPTLAIDEPQHGDNLRAVEEHGGEWVTCLTCGRQWAVYGDNGRDRLRRRRLVR